MNLERLDTHSWRYRGRVVALAAGTYDPANEASTIAQIEAVIDQAATPPATVLARRAFEEAVAGVKAEASRRIGAKYPSWKQINMIARGVELAETQAARTPIEAAEAQALLAAWAEVKAIRAASDAIEAEIAQALDPRLVNIGQHPAWP